MKLVFKYNIFAGTFVSVEDGGKVVQKPYEGYAIIGITEYRVTGDSVLEVVIKMVLKADRWYKAHGVVVREEY